MFGEYTNLFSVKLNHGGQFTRIPGRRYVDGKLTHIDLVDMDEFSIDLDRGILPLSSDEDVENLLRYVKNHKESESVELRKNMSNSRTTFTMDWNKYNEVGQFRRMEKDNMELVTDHGGKTTQLDFNRNFDPFDGINFDDIHLHEPNNKEVDVNDNLVVIGDTNDFIVDELSMDQKLT
nr:hypothetical protein [Tanacetum cinerariifolium]